MEKSPTQQSPHKNSLKNITFYGEFFFLLDVQSSSILIYNTTTSTFFYKIFKQFYRKYGEFK